MGVDPPSISDSVILSLLLFGKTDNVGTRGNLHVLDIYPFQMIVMH